MSFARGGAANDGDDADLEDAVADGLFDKILDQTLPPGPGPIAETNPGAGVRKGN